MRPTTLAVRNHNDKVRALNAIKSISHTLEMSSVKQTQLITAASELITNILKYAGEGRVTIETATAGPEKKVVVTAADGGPGIANIPQAMTRGFSTNQTLGLGLPGAKDLSDEFYIESKVGLGTTVIISKRV